MLITYKANKIDEKFVFPLESSIHAAEIKPVWIQMGDFLPAFACDEPLHFAKSSHASLAEVKAQPGEEADCEIFSQYFLRPLQFCLPWSFVLIFKTFRNEALPVQLECCLHKYLKVNAANIAATRPPCLSPCA